MVGFSKERFVDVTEEELDKYSCKLCEQVLMNPTVMTCCRRTVCEQCFRQWMTDNNKCRFCDRSLSYSSICVAPLLVTDPIDGFKIKCIFADKGCNFVENTEKISEHQNECGLNPEKVCRDCGNVGNEEHRCISVLKAKYESAKEIDSRSIEKSALMSARDSLISGQQLTVEEEANISQGMKETLKEIVTKQLIETNEENQETICDRILGDLKRMDPKKRWNIRFFMYGIGWRFSFDSFDSLCIVFSIGSHKVDVYTIKK